MCLQESFFGSNLVCKHFINLFSGSSTVLKGSPSSFMEAKEIVIMDGLAAKVQKYGKNQGFTIGARIFAGDDEIISYSFDCNVGAKRYSDLEVVRGFSKDNIAGCFGVVLVFFYG